MANSTRSRGVEELLAVGYSYYADPDVGHILGLWLSSHLVAFEFEGVKEMESPDRLRAAAALWDPGMATSRYVRGLRL